MADQSAITVEEFREVLLTGLPFARDCGIDVLALSHGTARLSLSPHVGAIRPGGTVSGPTLFTLADVALYAAVMSCIGRVELAVTSSMTINFLRRPPLGPLIADARILKSGRRLITGDILIRPEASTGSNPVAHASGSYMVPAGNATTVS